MRKSVSTMAAAGRRMDLASLFSMIGRHGPAVALAVIAIVSVPAVFIIYRTVRGKRRKATAEAAAADSDGQSRGVEEGEPSVIQPNRGELLHSSVSSTDVSDEDLSYVKEDVDLIQSDRKIRHRQAAAAAVKKKPSPYSPPKSEIQVPDPKHSTLDGTEEIAVVWDYYKVSEPNVEETYCTHLGPQMPSHEIENQPESPKNDTTVMLAEERTDDVYDPHVQYCCKDEPSVQTITNEVFDKASVAVPNTDDNFTASMSEEKSQPDMLASSQEVSVVADPETAKNITVSVTVEGVSCPHLQSICQDQQSDHMEITETNGETRVNSASEEPTCDNASITLPLMSEEKSQPDMLASCREVSVADTTCTDATEIPPPTEVKQTSTLSLVDENMENTKKVVAVPPMPQNVNVTFYVHYFPQSQYQMVAVTGNQQELGNWKGFIPLERAKDGHWTTVVSLPAESHVEWKFVVLDKGEVCRWEECGNHLLDKGYGDNLLVHKWWGIL